ncbi:hypothetical protein Q8A67_020424 [Cirrhinus molitorella]|uniref:PH domain-containing protein n=1 Tax=Cirrhinus molitorella TaxID=172907 RepID=A0AA88PBU3_9TELE|nr:hypothetical protein Q8A67_020424 [Cirrhinus molitorella]
MSNNKKSPAAKFYSEPTVEELYTGYLLKSPPLTPLTKNTKAWRNRFFMLSKTGDNSYQLTYHENNERKEKALGTIDISKISLLFTNPERHQKWDWVEKKVKCSPSSVLFLKVEDDIPKHSREYFLIGENSHDVEGWLNALVKAMKAQKSRIKPQHTDNTELEYRSRSMSVPVDYSEPKDDRWSAYELSTPQQYDHYDYPRKLSEPQVPITRKITVIKESDENDGTQDEPLEDNSAYMSMGSLQRVLEDDQQEDYPACKLKNEDDDHSKQSIGFNGNCASTELDNSETDTHTETEICSSPYDLEGGKPCVSQQQQIQDSRRDRTLSQGAVEGIQKCLKTLSQDEVKLLVQRFPGLNPNPDSSTEDTVFTATHKVVKLRFNIIQMNIKRKSEPNALCHNEAAEVEEVCTGFLLKSPPARQIKNTKSWKRRFFVLSKTKDSCHELKYYKTTERDKPIKSIEGSTITMVQKHPKGNPVFEWIGKSFKCNQSSVFLMKAENPGDKVAREFFFIGDNSDDMDRWVSALNGVIMNNQIKQKNETQITTESTSNGQTPRHTEKTEADSKPPLPPRMKSTPSEDATTQEGQCSQSLESSPSEAPLYENMKKEERQNETAVESNEDMSSGESMTAASEDSLLDSFTKAFNEMKTLETSTESDGQSETHTFIKEDICISQHDAKCLVISEVDGKPCVFDCEEIKASSPFHKGDQILAVNDLLTDTVEEVQTCLRRLSKSEVKLTILRLPDSIPLDSEPC